MSKHTQKRELDRQSVWDFCDQGLRYAKAFQFDSMIADATTVSSLVNNYLKEDNIKNKISDIASSHVIS